MTIIKDANVTPFYNTQVARIGQITPGANPEISSEGTPPLADQYGRFIVLVDGTANVRVVETVRYPIKLGSTLGFVNEGSIAHTSLRAITRVWGMASTDNAGLFFQLRLVDSVGGGGVIALSIPMGGKFGQFSQDMFVDYELDGVTYDTIYFNVSTKADSIALPPTPSLWLNYNYQAIEPVAAV